MIYAVEYTVGFGYLGILSNLSADSIQIDVNSNRTNKEISCLVRKCFLLGTWMLPTKPAPSAERSSFLHGYVDATIRRYE